MSSDLSIIKRKTLRRASIQYNMTAEAHVDNEMKHERLLTESSKLTSSWASFGLSNYDRVCSEDTISSQSSANSSPAVHRQSLNNSRTNSFTGPLMISVTCSNGSVASNLQSYEKTNSCKMSPHGGRIISSSCQPSPCPSPTNSIVNTSLRVQSFSPGSPLKINKRIPNQQAFASPLYESKTTRKRLFQAYHDSSAEISYESSPDPHYVPSKLFRMSGKNSEGDCPSKCSWPPSSPVVIPSISSSNSLNTIFGVNGQSSPSAISLPSPRLSSSSNANSPRLATGNTNVLTDYEEDILMIDKKPS